MRTADGLALLREIARRHGRVLIGYNGTIDRPWRVSLAGSVFRQHGATLEDAVAALYDQLERVGSRRT